MVLLGYLRSWAGAVICTALWLTAALSVAFPEHFFEVDFSSVAQAFVRGKERYYIGLLLFVDLIIDEDFWRRGQAAAAAGNSFVGWLARAFLIVTVLYAVIVSYIALNEPRAVANAGWITLAALLCLAYPRFLSYIRPAPRLARV